MSALMTVTATSRSTMARPSPFTRRARARDAVGNLLLLASDALHARDEAVQPLLMLLEYAFDFLTLSFHLRTQPTALDLNLAEAAIEGGEIGPRGSRLGKGYTGEHRQQLRRIGQQGAELRQRTKVGQGDDP